MSNMDMKKQEGLDKIIKAAAPLLESLNAPSTPRPLSEKALEMLRASRKEAFETVLSDEQMRVALLQLLTNGPSDGIDLIQRLTEKKISLSEGGDGAIYGILYRMESDGLIQGTWRQGNETPRKLYRLADKGKTLLGKRLAQQPELEEEFGRLGLILS